MTTATTVATTTTAIKYSCTLCGLTDIEVLVQAREANEDIIHWTNTVMIPALCLDHAQLSPDCHPTQLQNITIPMSGVEYIGGPTVH